jgi:hypothetical protein
MSPIIVNRNYNIGITARLAISLADNQKIKRKFGDDIIPEVKLSE